jgi:DNA-binding NtrC family response regulator
LHVAVVEDDDMVGDILKTILEQHDFDVTVVTNISTALQIPGVDLFVCDVHLPDGTGVALARQLLARMPDCRLILMSGSTAVVEVEELTLQGGQEIPILRKPFLLSQFLEQIYNLCGKPAKSETGRQVY